MSATPPGLQRFVQAAREQTIVTTNVTADAVLAGLEQDRRRTHARRTLTLSGAIAIAASLIAVSLLWPMLSARDAEPDAAGYAAGDESGHEFGPVTSEIDNLANAVSVRTNTSVEVRGPWSIALGEGTHELEVQPTEGEALRVTLPNLELELVEGLATIEVVHGTAAVRLHNGVAAWIGDNGQRSMISVEHVELDLAAASASQPGESAPPTATQLAREAEQLLAAGKSDKAAVVLRRLVVEYPKASQTRVGLLDLARLLRNSRRQDEARCAYQLYLQRWPESALDGEVRSQLQRLGPGRGCRGLEPR